MAYYEKLKSGLWKVAIRKKGYPHVFKSFHDIKLDFIKQISGKSGDSYNIRETGKFLSDLINELKIKYEIKE